MDYRRHKTPNKRVSRKRTRGIAVSTDYGFDDSITHIIGIDEAGWGAIAGPLYVGGCIVRVDDDLEWLEVKDSKRYTTERAREIAYANLERWEAEGKLEFTTWAIPADEVADDPARALMRSQLCVAKGLSVPNAGILVDGNKPVTYHGHPAIAVPKADSLFKVVSAASVVAKVERDRQLTNLGNHYTRFDFHKNKGYPTAQHLALLNRYGPCPAHRTNIRRVQDAKRILDVRKVQRL